VDTPDEVSVSQISGVRVRFIPEVGKDFSGKIVTRSLISNEIFRVEHDKSAAPAEPGGGGDGNEGGDGGGDNPIYIDPDTREG
jgi:hypothetical protein